MAVHFTGDLCLHQKNQGIIDELHSLDCLGQPEDLAMTDVVCFEVNPWGAGGPAPRLRRCRMKAVTFV